MITMKEIFKFNTGLPYYINHVIIAMVIGGMVTVSLLVWLAIETLGL